MKILSNKKYEELLKYKSKHKELVERFECILDRIYCWGEIMDPNMQMEMLMILKGDVKMKSLENLTSQEKFKKIENIFWNYFAKINDFKIKLMEIDFENYEFISLVKQLKEIGLDDFNYIYNKLGEIKNDVGCDNNEQEFN